MGGGWTFGWLRVTLVSEESRMAYLEHAQSYFEFSTENRGFIATEEHWKAKGLE
jgi:hypothetical protein